jgi:hypothetical protein
MRHVSQTAVAAALLAGRVLAHPHPATPDNNIQRRTVDLRSFPVGVGSSYANNLVLTEEKPQLRAFSAPTYVDTASQLVRKVAPGAEFRVVTSYKSDTGVGHIVLKQQVYGIDIDTADFNVNVSFARNDMEKKLIELDWQRWQGFLIRKLLLYWNSSSRESFD